MPDWKRVRINFPTVKLGQIIEPIKETIAEKGLEDFKTVYGVTNVEGITITGKKTSKDISNYILMYRNFNVGWAMPTLPLKVAEGFM